MRLSKTVQVHSILKIPKGFHNFPKSTTKLYIEEAQEAAGEKGQKKLMPNKLRATSDSA